MALLKDPRRRSLLGICAIVFGVGWASQGLRGRALDRLGAEVAARARPGDIRMLSSVTCEYCLKARSWFTAHGVPFSECFIERDTACAAQFSQSLAPGTPLLLVRGTRLIGFRADEIAAALAAR